MRHYHSADISPSMQCSFYAAVLGYFVAGWMNIDHRYGMIVGMVLGPIGYCAVYYIRKHLTR